MKILMATQQLFLSSTQKLPNYVSLHSQFTRFEFCGVFQVPGYTIEELFMLCKSANSQQKILALKTLSQICANSRRGRFIQLGSNVFQHLLDSGFAMLTRLEVDLDMSQSAVFEVTMQLNLVNY